MVRVLTFYSLLLLPFIFTFSNSHFLLNHEHDSDECEICLFYPNEQVFINENIVSVPFLVITNIHYVTEPVVNRIKKILSIKNRGSPFIFFNKQS